MREQLWLFDLVDTPSACCGRGYFEALLVNFAEAFSEQQLGEIRIVLDQLSRFTGEDEDLNLATKAKQYQLAQALRESE